MPTGIVKWFNAKKGHGLISCDDGSGDVLVKLSGNSHSDLSNPFPFDPAQQHCPDVITYGVPKTTSQGSIPQLYTSGWPSAALNDFKVGTYGGIPNAFGLLFSGPMANNRPFQGGTVLVAPPIKRELIFQFDFTGSAEIAIPVSSSMPGTTRHYQLWFQDPGDSFGTGLSDAVQVGFCP